MIRNLSSNDSYDLGDEYGMNMTLEMPEQYEFPILIAVLSNNTFATGLLPIKIFTKMFTVG